VHELAIGGGSVGEKVERWGMGFAEGVFRCAAFLQAAALSCAVRRAPCAYAQRLAAGDLGHPRGRVAGLGPR